MVGPDVPRGKDERPKLRLLEAFPVEHEGERAVALRDPAGFTRQVLVLRPPLLDLVSLFDGEHTVTEIQGILRNRHGGAPSVAQIASVVERLDAGGFLDSERFARERRAVEDAFSRSLVRPAAHAGGAYAGAPDALRLQIDSFFADAEGPGALAPGAKTAARPAAFPRGLIAPHIDFHRGGPTYAWAYRELTAATETADCFVILGTCHAGMPDPFAATLKPYQTPLGEAPVDRDFVEALERRYGHGLLASEGAHRTEHSIEFQAVMLRRLLGERPFTIVPILASFLHEALWAKGDPERDPRVPRFIDALLATMAGSGRRLCLIAGVDLAHVGPQFGDGAPNTEESLRTVESADRAMLESVTAGDALGFYSSVSFDGDARRICGLSPIYTFLRALPGVQGRLLRYSQWPDPAGAVSFCAAVFP